MSVVIDASVTLSWCFEDEASDASDALFASVARSGGIVPQLWVYEFANVLTLAQRRGRLTEGEAQRCFGMLDRLALDRVETPRPSELAAVAAAHALTAYDAAYLHAAMTRGASLATLDERLAAAATSAGVSLALSS